MVTVEKQYSLPETVINQVLAYLGSKPYTEVRTLVESILKAQLIQTPTTSGVEVVRDVTDTTELTSVAN